MGYEFQTCEVSNQRMLRATHRYIWGQSLESARCLCSEITTHGELFRWIDSLKADWHLDALRACFLIFVATDGYMFS